MTGSMAATKANFARVKLEIRKHSFLSGPHQSFTRKGPISRNFRSTPQVHSDAYTLNDGNWHWVEFQSSLDEASYKMRFEDGTEFENTNVNPGYGPETLTT